MQKIIRINNKAIVILSNGVKLEKEDITDEEFNTICNASDEEVIQIRKRYVNESAKQIYEDYKNRVSYQTFQAMLWGRSYKALPIYKKKEKKWINI